MSHRILAWLSIVALLMSAVGLGSAMAVSSNGADETIHACAATRDGSLRIIVPGDSCTTKERPLSWNQQGPTGPNGVSGWEIVTATTSFDNDRSKSVTAYCPEGKVVVGGGGFTGSSEGTYITNSFAQNSSDGQPGGGWALYAERNDGAAWRLVGQAICVFAH